MQASDSYAAPLELSEQGHARAQKRERILLTAARLFHEQGYRATSMDAIAEELGVTKPFLYYHFENKHELLEEIARRVMQLARAAFAEAAGEPLSPARQLERCARAYLRTVHQHRALFGVLFREAHSFGSALRAALREQEGAHLQQLSQLLSRGREQGVFQVEQPQLTAAAILRVIAFADLFSTEHTCQRELEEHHVRLTLRMAGFACLGA